MTKLEKLLQSSTISEDAKKAIREAWEDEKRTLAADIRHELTERYDADLQDIVTGMSKMINTVCESELKDTRIERKKLREDRVAVRASLSKFSQFANGVMAEEVQKLRKDRKNLSESLQTYMKFANGVMAEELKEFHSERRGLVEARVRLIAHGKRKIDEARRNFVKRAANDAADFIQECTKRELTELRVDLQEARANMFGRKLFEAFSAEFMGTMFQKDPVLKGLKTNINKLNSKVNESVIENDKLKKLNESLNRKIVVMEDTATRKNVISGLIKPLTASQKNIMESLLERTPTNRLNDDFNKYLPSVLKESNGVPAQKKTQVRTITESTGARKQPLVENVLDDDDDDELNQILALSKS